jgi:hypothetical protein
LIPEARPERRAIELLQREHVGVEPAARVDERAVPKEEAVVGGVMGIEGRDAHDDRAETRGLSFWRVGGHFFGILATGNL